MPDEKKERNESRIVIETPLTAPAEKPLMDRRGRISPWDKRWRRRVSRRA